MGYPIRLDTRERQSALKRRPLHDIAFAERFGEKQAWQAPAFADAADIRETIFARRSVRRFLPDAVTDGELAQILTAAQWAPSAGNHQPWRFIVIRETETKQALRANAEEAHALSRRWQSGNPADGELEPPFDYTQAPLLIAIAADPARGGPHIHGEATHIIGAGLCAQNMALMAHALGLGSVFLNHLSHEQAKVLLGIPYELDLAGVMAFGHPAEAPTSARLDRSRVVCDGGFDNRKGFTAVGVRHSGMREALAEYDVWRKRQGGKG
jgi:nitroreductase